MKLEIAGIATDEKKKLSGFRILGVFPFYLRYIRTDVHIRLCAIKEQIQSVSPNEPELKDFYDSKLQKELNPLINDYVLTALVNKRFASFFYKWLLNFRIKRCGHYHILNLYATIQKLDEPLFFLTYWKVLMVKDHTLLKEAK